MFLKKHGTQIKYIVLLMMLATFALPLKLGVADLSSGSKIFVSDLVIGVISVVYFACVFLKKHTLNTRQKTVLLCMIGFLMYLIITSIIHTRQFGFSKEYITLIRNFYTTSFILLFFLDEHISLEDIENVLLIFLTGANVYQLIYFCFNFEIRSSPLFFNIVIYAVVAQLLLVILFILTSKKQGQKRSKFKLTMSNVNLLLILILMPFTGLRSVTNITFCLALIYALYFILAYGRSVYYKFIKGMIIVVLSVGSVLAVSYVTGNTKTLGVFSRTFGIRTYAVSASNSLLSVALEQKKTVPKEKIEVVEDGSESDAFRNTINKKAKEIIQKNFWIGTGRLLIHFKHPSGKILIQQPHGFYLEWMIGYGIIGTILYVGFLMLPYVGRMRLKKISSLILSLITLGGFLAISMVQPTMSRILPVQIFFLIQVYFLKREDISRVVKQNVDTEITTRKLRRERRKSIW